MTPELEILARLMRRRYGQPDGGLIREWDRGGFGVGEMAEQEVAFDLGLIFFVRQELREPGLGHADALEQIALRLGHLSVEPASPSRG